MFGRQCTVPFFVVVCAVSLESSRTSASKVFCQDVQSEERCLNIYKNDQSTFCRIYSCTPNHKFAYTKNDLVRANDKNKPICAQQRSEQECSNLYEKDAEDYCSEYRCTASGILIKPQNV
ncbi:uncharacterized protein LOC100678307 [Nasonia vitripennis]|uniref:Uncharacterized protein n=1 Tax=Nasonia vitripennis TaxID=7425 RepID=A0A7M7GMC6_NASVI|nr:uncharacterized protein LOC100678307 [Nasonia vitripennis]